MDEFCGDMHEIAAAEAEAIQWVEREPILLTCVKGLREAMGQRRLAPSWKLRLVWHTVIALLCYRLLRPRSFLVVACRAMWRLNRQARAARRSVMGYTIYDLKNRFLRALYEMGLCVSVREQRQDLPCSGHYGYGCDGETCAKCGGTGVYCTVQLYRFTFQVAGRGFVWHQPANLVNWPVTVTEAVPEPYRQHSGQSYKRTGGVVKDLVVVWLALHVIRGLRLYLPGFAPQEDEVPFSAVYGWLPAWHRWRRVKRLWRQVFAEEEIPF